MMLEQAGEKCANGKFSALPLCVKHSQDVVATPPPPVHRHFTETGKAGMATTWVCGGIAEFISTGERTC